MDNFKNRSSNLDGRAFASNDAAAQRHNDAGYNFYENDAQAQQLFHQHILLWRGQVYGRHHLRNAAAFGIRRPAFGDPPRDDKTKRRYYTQEPFVSVINEQRAAFGIQKKT